jgi:hypothetical protein
MDLFSNAIFFQPFSPKDIYKYFQNLTLEVLFQLFDEIMSFAKSQKISFSDQT